MIIRHRVVRIGLGLGLAHVLLLWASAALAVMPQKQYAQWVGESSIRAIARIERVQILAVTEHFTDKSVIFRLEYDAGEEAQATFRGFCQSVDTPEQEQNLLVGDDIYYYPRKGERVYVTVLHDGGPITSMTLLTPELEQAVRTALQSLTYIMGEARVGPVERVKSVAPVKPAGQVAQRPDGPAKGSDSGLFSDPDGDQFLDAAGDSATGPETVQQSAPKVVQQPVRKQPAAPRQEDGLFSDPDGDQFLDAAGDSATAPAVVQQSAPKVVQQSAPKVARQPVRKERAVPGQEEGLFQFSDEPSQPVSGQPSKDQGHMVQSGPMDTTGVMGTDDHGSPDQELQGQFMEALGNDDLVEAELLIQNGARPEWPFNATGQTPLMAAESLAMAQMLCAHGARAATRDTEGGSVLHYAVSRRAAPELVPYLVSQGADPNAVGWGDETPLLSAVAYFNEVPAEESRTIGGMRPVRRRSLAQKVVESLVTHGARVDQANEEGTTALMRAASGDNSELVELLLQLGASRNARDNSGRTALDIAREKGNEAVARLLR